MTEDEKTVGARVDVVTFAAVKNADDALLAELGYKAEFKREFSVRETARKTCHGS